MQQSTELPDMSPSMVVPPPEELANSVVEQGDNAMPKSHRARALVITIVFALVILCGALWLRFSAQPVIKTIDDGQATMQIDTAQTVQEQQPNSAIFSGSLKLLDQDLQLFVPDVGVASSEAQTPGSYYEAGTFLEGPYQGYTRIIAIPSYGGAAGPEIFTLATKDFQTYVLDDSDDALTTYAQDDWRYPYHFLDQTKISEVARLSTEQPKEIVLDENFSLFRELFPVKYVKTGAVDKWGNPVSVGRLMTDFSEYQKLDSPFDNLTIYFKPYEQNTEYYDKLSEAEKQAFAVREQYFVGSTEVVIVDSTGLPRFFAQTTHQAIQQYLADEAAYQLAFRQYKDSMDTNGETTIKFPQSPQRPGIGFQGIQVELQTDHPLFSQYQIAIPDACAANSNTRVINISDDQLEALGTVRGQTVYKLKDSNNPLYKLEYDLKFSYYEQEFWKSANEGKSYKTLPEYVAQLPLLFLKDYWNRWVAVGEYDYLMPGGCGKPVVYLYPTEPTAVKVSLLAPTLLTTDIPTYRGGWQVLAHPDGSLLDLQPDATDCGQFSTAQVGAEYAAAACATRIYPYLYWAGNVTSIEYPRLADGWVVGRNELSQFFDEKLQDMGLQPHEISDFKAYWLPALRGKNAPYFRISFFQTDQVNQLFPMQVTPQPDTVFRMFMDYAELQSQPQQLPQPQQLQKLHRSGFTLVEWGGLKQ
ncbi:hypothetical protein KC921_03495 [Candidatus Woesebacteria bacterium]|nr:hypothetical protein [Candidatus Woesebacteria bacterium]